VEEALNDMDKAVENMEKAISYNNQDINYIYNLGRLLQARGKDDDNKNAEAIYKKILEVRPNEANVHLSLGMLYEKTKKKNEAIAEYQKVFDIIPEESKDARDKVNKMISNARSGIENTPESLGLNQPENVAPQSNVNSTQSVPEQNISAPEQPAAEQSEPVAPAPITTP
jgi:tetratricopeptide (TPR) repeat protein